MHEREASADIRVTTLPDESSVPAAAGTEKIGVAAVPEAYRPLADCLEECIVLARSMDAPLALLLLSPRVRRPTGQRLGRQAEATVLQNMVALLTGLVLRSDRVVQVELGLVAIILYGATGIGARGVSRKIARRVEGVRDLAGRDVRVRARFAFSLFPAEGMTASDMIWLARARLAAGE
jgi:GGDEF domain-containing protein